MSGEILFLAHRLPFPPDRGDKIRSHHLLKALATLAPVHVGCLAEGPADKENAAELARVAKSFCMPERRKPVLLAGLEALVTARPVSVTAFRHAELRDWVIRLLAERPIDTIFVFSGQMGQYVPTDWAGRLVVDLCDVDSAKFEAFGARRAWPLGWIHRREADLLRGMEERLAKRAERTLLISRAEADLFRSRLDDPGSVQVSVLGNGIDATAFNPDIWKPRAELLESPGPHIVFTGQMDYAPNIEAVQRFATAILPTIRQQHPLAHFHVVGRAPTAAVRELAGEAVTVWGEVPAVQPFLAAADLVVAPLALARGVQNKVLEAMAMACPVLLTSHAATGFDAIDGLQFAIADDDDAALARRALALLADRDTSAKIGEEARRFVTERMSWPAMLAELPAIIGRAQPAGIHRDAA